MTAAGLNTSEAKCYRALLQLPQAKPSELAKIVGETRTNCYKILDNLTTLKLVERIESGPTYRFRAANPARLLELARERRRSQEQAERQLEVDVQGLLASYTKLHGQPGVRYYTGKEGTLEIFEDQLTTGKPIHFLYTVAGIEYYSYHKMHDLHMRTAKAGIKRYGLTPDNVYAFRDFMAGDKDSLLSRTWLAAQDYTAPVEWGAYGDKVYIISFQEEAFAMTIESPAIAEAFRQIFRLIEQGQYAKESYASLPKLAGSQMLPSRGQQETGGDTTP